VFLVPVEKSACCAAFNQGASVKSNIVAFCLTLTCAVPELSPGQPPPGIDKAFGLEPGTSRHMHELLRGNRPAVGSTRDYAREYEAGRWKETVESLARLRDSKRQSYDVPEGLGEAVLIESQKPAYRGCFDHVETLTVHSYFPTDVLAAIFLEAPKLQRLEFTKGDDWVSVESYLNSVAASDPTYADTLKKRIAAIRDIVVRNFHLDSQASAESKIEALASGGRATSLHMFVSPKGDPREDVIVEEEARKHLKTRPVDLRGLNRLRSLRSLTVTLQALGRVSIGIPAQLKHLTIQEMGECSSTLSHLALPPKLESITVFTDNASTKRFFKEHGDRHKIPTKIEPKSAAKVEPTTYDWKMPERADTDGKISHQIWKWEVWEKANSKSRMKIRPDGFVELDDASISSLGIDSNEDGRVAVEYSFADSALTLTLWKDERRFGFTPNPSGEVVGPVKRSSVRFANIQTKHDVIQVGNGESRELDRFYYGHSEIKKRAESLFGGTWRRLEIQFDRPYTPVPPDPKEDEKDLGQSQSSAERLHSSPSWRAPVAVAATVCVGTVVPYGMRRARRDIEDF
jgi:hypothetical protein